MEQKTESSSTNQKKVRQDLTGKRFGKLTVLEYVKVSGQVSRWKCRCDCGNIAYKTTGHLNAGLATSCGCSWRQPAVRNGERYGRLIAVRPTGDRSSKSVVWECQCDCGMTVNVRATALTSGHTTSCGCVKRELDDKKDFRDILTYIDDTCVEFAKNISKPRNSTSAATGVRGVVLKGGKYTAQISFRKKRYHLGCFSRLEDAVKARKQAEEMVAEYVAGHYEDV